MVDVAIVGEAYGEAEAEALRPFIGPSGKLLRGMLRASGIDFDSCLVTNVFNLRPLKNDVLSLCGPKASAIPGLSMLQRGKYVRAEFGGELARLDRELRNAKPNLILALGATAAWAVLGTQGISRIRGYLAESKYGKVLPTYHPAAVLRDWSLRPIVMMDLAKARRESEFPEYVRPSREIWIEPNLSDLLVFERDHIVPSPDLSIDIETKANQITCIGFAPTASHALVVPFYDARQPDGNYWRTIEDELSAWRWVRRICALKRRILGQNFVYDMAFTWRSVGIPIPHAAEDCMLLHHALQPELEKGLGFLASIYTDEQAWKFMGKRNVDTIKKAE